MRIKMRMMVPMMMTPHVFVYDQCHDQIPATVLAVGFVLVQAVSRPTSINSGSPFISITGVIVVLGTRQLLRAKSQLETAGAIEVVAGTNDHHASDPADKRLQGFGNGPLIAEGRRCRVPKARRLSGFQVGRGAPKTSSATAFAF